MLKENPVMKKFDLLVKSLSSSDRIAICHDLDADGISSGALTSLAIKLLRGSGPDLVISQPFKTVEFLPSSIELLKEHKINKLIVVDFALDQKQDSIRNAQKVLDNLIIIDHHKDYNFKEDSKTLTGLVRPDKTQDVFIIKPQFVSDIEPSKYPCSKFCYDLFSRHVNLKSHSWAACAGLMGDNQFEEWKDFVLSEAKAHKSTKSEIWKVTQIISSVEVLAPTKINELLHFIVKAKNPKAVVKSKYTKYLKKLDAGVKKLMKVFVKKKEIHPNADLIWFEFNSENNMKSILINKVSNELYPSKTIIFVQDKGDGFVSFSARGQDFKVKTNELLETAVKGFENAGAGGHIPASAGRIMKKDLPELKRRIIHSLTNAKNMS